MKKIILLFLFFNFGFSQVEDICTNITGGINNLVIKNNQVYFCSFVNKKLYKKNINSTYNPQVVYQFNENPINLLLDNNKLFVGTENSNKTYQFQLTDNLIENNTITNQSGSMLKIGDYLYIGKYSDSQIIKINLNTNETFIVLDNIKPNFLYSYNNEIYFTSNVTNKLCKFNPEDPENTLETVLSNMNYAAGIAIQNDILVVCESQANSITTYNLNTLEIINSYYLGENSWPNGLFIDGDYVYFTQTIAGKVSRIPLNQVLSSNSFTNLNNNISIYPNPSSDYISIDNSENENINEVLIYDINGKLLIKTNSQYQIDIRHLSKGIYILKTKIHTQKFIKN